MIRILRFFLLAGILTVGALIGVRGVRDHSHVNELAASIQGEEDNKRSNASERAVVDREMKLVGKKMSALPDTLRKAKMGEAMMKARQFAKRQEILDGDDMRANAKIRALRAQQAQAQVAFREYVIKFGGVGLVILVALFVLRRFSS